MVGSMLPITPGMSLMTPSQIALRKPSIKQYSGLIPRPSASIANQLNMTGATPYNPTPYNPTPALSIKLNPNQKVMFLHPNSSIQSKMLSPQNSDYNGPSKEDLGSVTLDVMAGTMEERNRITRNQ